MKLLLQHSRIIVLLSVFVQTLCANEEYFIEAGKRFSLSPKLLQSIAKVESNMNPTAINRNPNGTYDLGIMQINSIHLPFLSQFGITKKDLFDPRININFGAFVLAKCRDKHGFTLNGLNCYNGRISNNPYAMKVVRQLAKLEQKQ